MRCGLVGFAAEPSEQHGGRARASRPPKGVIMQSNIRTIAMFSGAALLAAMAGCAASTDSEDPTDLGDDVAAADDGADASAVTADADATDDGDVGQSEDAMFWGGYGGL